MKINIDIPDDLLKAVDEAAKKEYFNRSEWIRSAMRAKLFYREVAKTPVIQEPPIGEVRKPEWAEHKMDREVPKVGVEKTDPVFKGKPADEGFTWEWCQANRAHEFVGGELKPCLKVSFFDGDGNPSYYEGRYFGEKWVCEDCLRVMKEKAPEGMRFEEVTS